MICAAVASMYEFLVDPGRLAANIQNEMGVCERLLVSLTSYMELQKDLEKQGKELTSMSGKKLKWKITIWVFQGNCREGTFWDLPSWSFSNVGWTRLWDAVVACTEQRAGLDDLQESFCDSKKASKMVGIKKILDKLTGHSNLLPWANANHLCQPSSVTNMP